jgi:hypothetical protein
MITDTTRVVAEMMDGVNKMTGAPPDAIIDIARHATKRAGLDDDTVDEALRYLREQDRL